MKNKLKLSEPQVEVKRIIDFIQAVFSKQKFERAVIGVSGGVDSALSLTLLSRALGPSQIVPVFMPYGEQSAADAQLICTFNQIDQKKWQQVEITGVVDAAAAALGLEQSGLKNRVRLGNIMARVRMMTLYDLAKKNQALVCGTENKSENMLGYFTRYGDEGCDLDPIVHLFKTQVRQLAEFLGLPERFLTKPPSAGLWANQTDEQELGFEYEQADQVLLALSDNGVGLEDLSLAKDLVQKVINQVEANQFKHQAPYKL